MRRRNLVGISDAGPKAPMISQLKQFDVYSKVHDDYSIKTRSGGAISLVALLAMVILFISELNQYLTVEVIDHIIVDTTLNQKLAIGVNITFAHLRCDEVSVDTVDSTGENQADVRGGIVKIELDAQGRVSRGDHQAADGECLDCLEAKEYMDSRSKAEGQQFCCNSCQELKDAYNAIGLPYYHILDTAPQCKDSIGCRITGDVSVAKVGGNMHVALGKSTIRDGKLVHDFNIKDVTDGFNTSHQIHRLRFGEAVPGVDSPLEGTTKICSDGAWMFHYYVKLVPTLFTGQNKVVYTHQYSVTDSAKNVMVRNDELSGLPGVFVVYEFNPFMVQKVEKVVPLSHFLTSVSAIIGGIFTVAGLIDGLLYRGLRKVGIHKE